MLFRWEEQLLSTSWRFERSSQAEVNVSTEVIIHQKTMKVVLVV